eukprot:CAMPEP_0198123318 /NCGR_PEP_ID=MMETSP1442-20131203/37207_1 /TAXON_ID= /ORGANISM="Craspedostauros australis, Strain CCMP3328" /LENGTH=809 /DNA_ID=CAMNT_0043782511 /DNA_START=152 /DNA_END=2581 /DNA_ORIENTATION=+
MIVQQILKNNRSAVTHRGSALMNRAGPGALRQQLHHPEQRRTILGISKALDKRLYRMAKGVMPTISKTEQIALGCGSIGFDRDIFAGDPSLQSLVEKYDPKLTAEEQSFLDNELNELCALINDHDVSMQKDFTKEAWDFMRDKGFFSLKIPKEWGGKGFSTHAVSHVLSKIGTHCVDANATVAVPNSLGPGELLARYGTQEQKEYFMPRLADGTLIPCFGLTGPHSGSDATSLIQSDCVVEERNGEIGVVASFKKRYITLAPVAGVVGLGLNLSDPKGLLKGNGEAGFTVALLERDHPGLMMGRRHMPLNAAFMNGTVEGEDVWIPMSNILGGQKQCGFGWHMFVECLAEGRGVSLPAGAAGAGRAVVGAVGAYSRVRKQFRVPIAEFGGIQEAMSLIGSDALINVAGTDLMNAIIDNHEAPMVISSIMKQNCTERGRRIVERGMDIAAGSAICRGDTNYLGNSYMNMPIGITVEGANIMTRSFQIIGQGLTRCHPHMLDLILALQLPQEQEEEGVKIFRQQFYKVVQHGLSNFGRSLTRGVSSSVSTATRSSSAYKNGDKLLKYHEDQLKRLSANFALTADLCFTLGGRLKFEELLMGRLSDALGAVFLGYATLHHYSRHRGVEGLEVLTEHAMLRLEKEAQDALKEASDNFPGPLGMLASTVMKLGCFPMGGLSRPYRAPSDGITKEVSRLLTTPSELRDMFTDGVYMAKEGEMHQVSDLIRALPVCIEADRIASSLRRQKRQPTAEETDLIAQADALRDVLIQVNVFDHLTDAEGQEGYVRPALAGTDERMEALERKSFTDQKEVA